MQGISIASVASAQRIPSLKTSDAHEKTGAPDATERAQTVNETAPAKEQEVPRHDKTKLFNAGSLPIGKLFEVKLSDDNKDGRIDASDAIPKYLLIATQARENGSDLTGLDTEA